MTTNSVNVPLSLDGSDSLTEREALERLPKAACRLRSSPRGARCKKVDDLIETPDVIVVIDHKSLSGRATNWPDQVRKHAGRLRLYGGDHGVAADAKAGSARPAFADFGRGVGGGVRGRPEMLRVTEFFKATAFSLFSRSRENSLT